jgi:hypothetical protein
MNWGINKPNKMMTTAMKHIWKYAWWTAAVSVVVVVAVVLSTYVGRTTSTVSHIMTFNTDVPTRFSPQPNYFCNALNQGGGLQQMVDDAGIGSTSSASTETANLLMLKAVVVMSPDQSTRSAMVSLYQDVLNGNSRSSAALGAISDVTNSCAGYP